MKDIWVNFFTTFVIEFWPKSYWQHTFLNKRIKSLLKYSQHCQVDNTGPFYSLCHNYVVVLAKKLGKTGGKHTLNITKCNLLKRSCCCVACYQNRRCNGSNMSFDLIWVNEACTTNTSILVDWLSSVFVLSCLSCGTEGIKQDDILSRWCEAIGKSCWS